MTAFEDGLWERLVEAHDADLLSITAPRPRDDRRALIVGGSLTGLAAAIAAAVIGISAATTAPPAYAMTQNSNGSYTLTINNLDAAIPQLNAKFAQMGINETVVPVTASCTSDTPPGLVWMAQTGDRAQPSIGSLTFLGPGGLQPGLAAGDTGVVVAEQLANGEIGTYMGELPPPVPSCFSRTTMHTAFPQLPAAGASITSTETVTPAS